MNKEIVLTGIKPTGKVHLGNYIGAIKPALQIAEGSDCTALYFIADYHALTFIQDKQEGAGLICEVENLPCFGPGKQIAAFYNQPELAASFVKAAANSRGIICSIEREGSITSGDICTIIPYKRGII